MKTLELRFESFWMRPFCEADLDGFAELHADPNVMADLGGPIGRSEAAHKLNGYIEAFETYGYGRMAVLNEDDFIGYVGVTHRDWPDHPLRAHDEIGWRLKKNYWKQGIASRAARLALRDAFERNKLPQVLAYTAASNLRSQAVMDRLGLERCQDLDFEEAYAPLGTWHGMVWRATSKSISD